MVGRREFALDGFRSLLPGGNARGPLSDLARLYLGMELDADVQIVLDLLGVTIFARWFVRRNFAELPISNRGLS